MSMYQEAKSEELVAIYQRAHEELADLQSRSPSPLDQSVGALEIRAAIERHRTLIRELRRALHSMHSAPR